MHKEFLSIKPKAYYCPMCNQMHRWNPSNKMTVRFFNKDGRVEECESDILRCPASKVYYAVGRKNGKIIYQTNFLCTSTGDYVTCQIDAEDFEEKSDKPLVTYNFEPKDYVGLKSNCVIPCKRCNYEGKNCFFGKHRKGYNCAFEYYTSDYNDIVNRREDMERNRKTTNTSTTNTSATNDADNKMKIWTKLYEQSPKQNLHEAWDWAKAHEATFKWAVPVVSIFVAYKILNSEKSRITINNINEIAKGKLGISLDSLQNKNALKKLMEIGGVCATAYAAYEFLNRDKKSDDVEATMEALEKASQEHRFIGKQAEKLLPVATSVIIVYLMTQKPKWLPSKDKVTEVIQFIPKKVRTYGGLILGEAAERFGIDTDDEEQMHKVRIFAFLGLVVAAVVLFYGVKMIKKRDDETKISKMEENMKAFVQQILAIMKALLPTAFTSIATILVTRKVLEMTDVEEMEAVEVETVSEVTVE